MTPGERRRFLALLGFLTFATVYVGVVMAPVLTQIGSDFGVSTGTAGLAVAAYGIPGAFVGLLAGPYSDRFGRKRFLVAGSLLMGIFTLLSAFATTFPMLVALRTVAGAGASIIFPNSTATVADNVPYRERAQAMSMVIAFNTMASVIGVPIAGIVAEATTWRVSVAIVGVLSIAAAVVLYRWLQPAQTPVSEAGITDMYRSIAKRSAIAAIFSTLLGSLYWFTWATYIVVFFELVFGLSRGIASTVALTQGLGILLGSQIGGRLGARIGHKRVVAGSVVISGLLLFALTNATPPLVLTAVVNFALSAVIGARFATNTTLLSEQVPEARGTLLALSSSVTNLSLVMGAAVGGILIDAFGFWSVGLFCLGAALLAGVVVALFVREEPIDLEIAPAT